MWSSNHLHILPSMVLLDRKSQKSIIRSSLNLSSIAPLFLLKLSTYLLWWWNPWQSIAQIISRNTRNVFTFDSLFPIHRRKTTHFLLGDVISGLPLLFRWSFYHLSHFYYFLYYHCNLYVIYRFDWWSPRPLR